MPNEPLTEDQLHLIAEHTQRATAKALAKYRRSAIAGFLVLLLGLLLAFHGNAVTSADSRKAIVQSGRAIAVDGCNRDFKTIGALRGIIGGQAAQLDGYVKDGTITRAQAIKYKAQIAQQLKVYVQPDCRAALSVVTDDPDAAVRVPVPLFPKDG